MATHRGRNALSTTTLSSSVRDVTRELRGSFVGGSTVPLRPLAFLGVSQEIGRTPDERPSEMTDVVPTGTSDLDSVDQSIDRSIS